MSRGRTRFPDLPGGLQWAGDIRNRGAGMKYVYREFDGIPFQGQDALGLFDQLLEFVLEHGQPALDALARLQTDPRQQELLDRLVRDGLLEKAAARWRLTPRAVRAMQRKALMEIFSRLRAGRREGHEAPSPGSAGERDDGTRPYQFGDPTAELDLGASLRNAIRRCGPGLPLRLREEDLELHRTEAQACCSTVILLDMSGSMARYRRFYHAKKCAMAVHALVTQRYPQDTVDLVGFYSAAAVIPEHRLPLIGPQPVTILDHRVRLRVPIDRVEEGPLHFTNLQMGLRLAGRLLRRRGGDHKQVFIITDGQPTAHLEGDCVHLVYPPDRQTALATLQEALSLSRQGVRVCTFALTEDYAGLEWVGFVDRMTRLTRGVAFYCAGGDLSECLMESYLSGRRTRTHLA